MIFPLISTSDLILLSLLFINVSTDLTATLAKIIPLIKFIKIASPLNIFSPKKCLEVNSKNSEIAKTRYFVDNVLPNAFL